MTRFHNWSPSFSIVATRATGWRQRSWRALRPLVSSASTALEHAKAAEKVKARPHTKEITHLNEAITEGKENHPEAATRHAEEALTHLEAAQK